MITKVVLGVVLVLIEFSIIISSQNNSLSSNNDTFTAKFQTISDFTTSESHEKTTTTTTTAKTTTTATTSTAVTDFKLPENCSSYKVSFSRLRNFVSRVSFTL